MCLYIHRTATKYSVFTSVLSIAVTDSVFTNLFLSFNPFKTAEFDYTAPPSEFLFQPSVEPRQTECVEVFLVNDDILEDVETFHLEISTAVPRVDVSLSTAVVIMMDDDDVYVSLVSSEYSVEEEAERREVEVCVQLTGVIEREVEVTLFTEEDTAHGEF